MKKYRFFVVILVLIAVITNVSAKENYRIGIAQFAVHGSLDNCREGFIEGLAEHGFVEDKNITIEVQNAQSDMGLASQIADSFLAAKYDLVCAIATPMAAICANTFDDKIPVIYCAVSDPSAAGLADENGKNIGKVTGTSDTLPIEDQLIMMRALLPEAKNLGLMYTVGEANSAVQVKMYEELAPKYGFDVVVTTVSNGSEIALAVPGLISKCDCISMVLDNTVVQYLDVLLEQADAAKIPVFGSEVEQVILGCVAAEGLDYIALGKHTGDMAAMVLKGEDANSIPYKVILDNKLYINTAKLEELNITVPEELLQRATIVD
ncbi:MAG TPA: ABC transporter substrate-binding protein [Christensenellaceae bacterium]|nr:ABC transporter substrate-binding protein [Christensenellaceae bacterium]